MVSSTNHEAPLCAVFSSLLSLTPSQPHISPSALYPRTPSNYVIPPLCQNKLRIHTKQQAKLQMCILVFVFSDSRHVNNLILLRNFRTDEYVRMSCPRPGPIQLT